MTANYETHEHDVLIIGAGGAGLRAAIEALAKGANDFVLKPFEWQELKAKIEKVYKIRL